MNESANKHERSGVSKPDKASLIKSIVPVLRAKPRLRDFLLVLSILAVPASLTVVWYVWYQVLPGVWEWGFDELSLKAIPGAVAVFFLAILPIYVPVVAAQTTLELLAIYGDLESEKVDEVLDQGSRQQVQVENELKQNDPSGLISLVQYSRVQLEAYYRIALTQTQRSFRYSVIAMWIGFAIIVAGVIVSVVDLQRFGLRPASDISTMVIVAGAIVEMISALFLWVYRSSINQLTYFYNRQMHNHSVVLCERIAGAMSAADDTRKMIVEKVLDATWRLEREPLPSGKSLLSFGANKGKKTA